MVLGFHAAEAMNVWEERDLEEAHLEEAMLFGTVCKTNCLMVERVDFF